VKSILIVGFYGYKITGDDAILESMLHDFRQAFPESKTTVTSINPETTAAAYDVDTIALLDQDQLIDAIRTADLIVIGGGGVYNEYDLHNPSAFMTDEQSFASVCCCVPIICKTLAKPCMVYAVGIEPIQSNAWRDHLRLSLTSADLVSLRDEGSRRILEQNEIQLDAVHVTADPAFRLEVDIDPHASLELDLPCTPFLAVSARYWGDTPPAVPSWENGFIRELDLIVESLDRSVVFVPFHAEKLFGGEFSDDTQLFRRVVQSSRNRDRIKVVESYISPFKAIQLFQRAECVIAMRFHAIVLSTLANTPFVAINYSTKVRSAVEGLSLNHYCIELDELGSGKLQVLVSEAISSSSTIKAHLSEQLEIKRAASRLNLDMLDSLVERSAASKVPVDYCGKLYLDSIQWYANALKETKKQLAVFQTVSRSLILGIADQRTKEESPIDALLAIKHSHPELHYLTAYALFRKGEYNKAIGYFEKAVDGGFDSIFAYWNCAICYVREGEPAKACDKLRPVVRLPEFMQFKPYVQSLMIDPILLDYKKSNERAQSRKIEEVTQFLKELADLIGLSWDYDGFDTKLNR
jgi:polysaccharide pyruvyl transferase CsaB